METNNVFTTEAARPAVAKPGRLRSNDTCSAGHVAPPAIQDWYWLLPSVLLLILVPLYCARGRIFWEDEVLGSMLLRDPSFHHMVSAWLHGADGGGFSFYLTGRWWFDLFGPSIRSFRMYSTAFFAIGYVVNWWTMRRFYPASIVTGATLSIWLFSPVLVQHYAEGRFYGLLMAAVAVAIYLSVRAGDRRGVRAWLFAGLFMANALLVTSHVLGVVYSACILLGMVFLDRCQGRFRPLLYGSVLLSWLLLIPSLPAIRASAAVGKPYFWTTQPDVLEFVSNYSGFTVKLLGPILLLALSIVIALVRRGQFTSTIRDAFAQRRPIYTTGALLFVVPLALYFEGFFGPALCISRYLQPVAFASGYLVAELLLLGITILPKALRQNTRLNYVAWAVFLVALLAYDFRYRPRHTGFEKDYTGQLTANLPAGVPIVCEDAFAFTELISREHNSPVRYMFLLDWKNSLAHDAPRLEVTQYHLMKNWKENGYYSGYIYDAASFLQSYPTFYSISMRDAKLNAPDGYEDRSTFIGSKLHQHLAQDPHFTVTLFKVVELDELKAMVWHICRKDAGDCR